MQPAITNHGVLCPRSLHRLESTLICLDPKGQSDPRICPQCQNHPETRSHRHRKNNGEYHLCMNLNALNNLNSDTQYNNIMGFLQEKQTYAEEMTKSVIKRLELNLKAFKQYLKVKKEEGQLRGRTRRTSELIRTGEWNGLSCQDIHLFKKAIQKKQENQNSFENLKEFVEQELNQFEQLLNIIQNKIDYAESRYTVYRLENDEELLQNGDHFKNNRQYELAQKHYRRSLQLREEPKRSTIYNRLGLLESHWNRQLGDQEELRYCRKCLKLSNSKMTALYNLGKRDIQEEEYEKARQHLIVLLDKGYTPETEINSFLRDINRRLGIDRNGNPVRTEATGEGGWNSDIRLAPPGQVQASQQQSDERQDFDQKQESGNEEEEEDEDEQEGSHEQNRMQIQAVSQ